MALSDTRKAQCTDVAQSILAEAIVSVDTLAMHEHAAFLGFDPNIEERQFIRALLAGATL